MGAWIFELFTLVYVYQNEENYYNYVIKTKSI